MPRDVFMVNCIDLITDMLVGWNVTCEWVPRDENQMCDMLARAAVASKLVVV